MHFGYRCRWVGALSILAATLSAATEAPAQQAAPYNVQGSVLDAVSRQPLADVAVTIRGTTRGSLTNRDGQFSIVAALPAGTYTLEFSFIGRGAVTRQVVLGADPQVRLDPIYLQETVVTLNEIVVTGAGAPTERRALGNTIESISGEAVNGAPGAASVEAALQGKVTGALISQNAGQPGGGMSIRLRGTSSIFGGADPLYVVDGVIVDNSASALLAVGSNGDRDGSAMANRLADLAPGDIERIEILKGAAAAALYGSRANAGVIQIFTKRGQQGAPRITYRSELSVSEAPKRYELNMSPYAGPRDITYVTKTKAVGDTVTRYDFQDRVFRTGVGTSHQLSISGGNEGTSYYLSGSYQNDEGILRSSGYKNAGARAKITQQVTDWLEVTANANVLQTHRDFVPEGEQGYGVLTNLIFTPTTFNHGYDEVTGRHPYSPVLGANMLDILDSWQMPEDVVRLIGGVDATLRPLDNLTLRYQFGIDDYRQESKMVRPPLSNGAADQGYVANPIRLSRQYNHDLTATHEAALGAGVGLTATAGFRYTSDRGNILSLSATDLPPGQTLVSGATQFASQALSEFRTVGGFLQERVAFGDRFFVTGGVNVEASSAFGGEERWQLFPRISGSYLLHQEPFWQNSGIDGLFSTLRLRAAYGETGGQPPGAYLRFDNYFGLAFSGKPGYVASTTLGNPNLKPERQREYEAGFEAGIFGDRAVLELTYYDQRTADLVLPVDMPLSLGVQRQYRNIGMIANKGVETALSTVNVSRAGLTWRSRLSVSANRNKVERLYASSDTLITSTLGGDYINIIVEGQPIGIFYGGYYERDDQGNIAIDPATGLGRQAKSGTGAQLKKVVGDPNPDFIASLSNTFELGDRVEFSFLLDGRFGNDVANFSRRIMDWFGTSRAVEMEIDRTVARKADPSLPPLKYSANTDRFRTYEEYVEDGSFVKMRELALRIRFDQALVQRLGAESVDLRVAGRNLYTWTRYSGLDPEINMFGANTVARGVDFATTPIPRSFVFGLGVNF